MTQNILQLIVFLNYLYTLGHDVDLAHRDFVINYLSDDKDNRKGDSIFAYECGLYVYDEEEFQASTYGYT